MKAKQLGLLLFLFFCIPIHAQEKEETQTFTAPDSLNTNSKYSPRIQRLIDDPLTPSKAAFYSAVVPGLGQAYLGKAWKVPIIYAAIGASSYYYDQNNKIMNSYRTAYKRRLNGFFDDEFLEKAIPIETEQLLIGMEFHKNYRDIAIVLAAAAYMLNILEANVSAHLLQFNVSEDLTVTPNIIVDQEVRGLRLALKF